MAHLVSIGTQLERRHSTGTLGHEADAQAASYRAAVELERTTAELPETALDASLGA